MNCLNGGVGWGGHRYGKCDPVLDCEAGSSGQLWFIFCLGSLQWVGIAVFCHSLSALSGFNIILRRGGARLISSRWFLPLPYAYVEGYVGKVQGRCAQNLSISLVCALYFKCIYIFHWCCLFLQRFLEVFVSVSDHGRARVIFKIFSPKSIWLSSQEGGWPDWMNFD